jgi:hypothetical protein
MHENIQTIDRSTKTPSHNYLNAKVFFKVSGKMNKSSFNREGNVRYGASESEFCFLQNQIFVNIVLVILFFSALTNGGKLQSKNLSLREKHLVRCLTYISMRYFAPGRSLVILSPSKYRDVQQELIAHFHRTSIWPVVVSVYGNISKPNKTDFVDRNGS